MASGEVDTWAVGRVREMGIGGERYRLIGTVTETLGGSYRLLRADARQISTPAREVCLTRLEAAPEAIAKTAELKVEARLHERVAGLPRLLAREERGGVFSFVTAMPAGAALPAVHGRPPYPIKVLNALVRSIPQLGRTLESLHVSGRAHRALRPEVLIASRDRLWLRDAGLAATPPVAGEGVREYRAPEQERPLLSQPGPPADVYQLAAIVYHLATGEPAGSDPLRPTLLRPEFVPALEEPVLAALASDPRRRPSLREFLASLEAPF
ncbi:hypothetical protein [Actinoplanes sp. NPDC051851]|uniref:hypothetical protein n=1 Tax=Actinoplanes sp. NPDC051851 TaxID=3154753 RepID=UPI0034126892